MGRHKSTSRPRTRYEHRHTATDYVVSRVRESRLTLIFFLFAASWFELDLVFDVARALSVVDCDDRYHNIMRFVVVTLAVAGGSRQTVNITFTHGIANMGMAT